MDHVGGHNLFEPVLLNVPVLFGPHMQGQPDLTELILSAQAGIQLRLEALTEQLIDLFQNKERYHFLKDNCAHLAHSAAGSTAQTYEKISPFL